MTTMEDNLNGNCHSNIGRFTLKLNSGKSAKYVSINHPVKTNLYNVTVEFN
jgi:hypothetical protein